MKNFITAFSLSNLCFLAAWRDVFYPPFNGYHLESPPTAVNALALDFDILIFAAPLFTTFVFVRRAHHKYLLAAARCAFLFLAVAALNNLIKESIGAFSLPVLISIFGEIAAVTISTALIFFAVFSLIKWSRQIIKIAQIFILLLSPLILLTFFHSAEMFAKDGFFSANEKVSAAQPGKNERNTPPKPRIVWIIFDEFDYRAAFTSRPATLKLPEFDRLAAQSFFATNAFPPAGATIRSIPALLTGKFVADAQPKTYDELSLRFADSDDFVDWKTQPNIFSSFQTFNEKTALVGWYHPYCRLFKNDLTECTARTNNPDAAPNKHSNELADGMLDYFWEFGQTLPLLRELLPKHKNLQPDDSYDKNHIEVTEFLSEQGVKSAANPAFSFVYLHLPSTHQPYFYNRQTRNFDVHRKTNYFNALALADDTFGDLRRAMERAGVWENSVVIVSTDHWWRTIDWENEGTWSAEEAAIARADKDFRVPFIVKPASSGEKHLVYESVFNTVLTHDLILEIRRGKVSTSGQIALWLDNHRTIGKSDY